MKNNSNEKLRNIFSNYIFLKSKNDNVLGIFMTSKCNGFNSINIVSVYKDNSNMGDNLEILIDNNDIIFKNIHLNDLSKYENIDKLHILFDRDNIFKLTNENNIDNTKELNIDDSFYNNLEYISKIEEPINEEIKDDQRYNSLKLFFANIVMNNNKLDIYRYMQLYSFIRLYNLDLYSDDKDVLLDVLYDSRVKVEGKINYNIKQLKLKK